MLCVTQVSPEFVYDIHLFFRLAYPKSKTAIIIVVFLSGPKATYHFS